VRLHKKVIKIITIMTIVAMTGVSYPCVRIAVDLFVAGGWPAIRQDCSGRSKGDGRVI